MNNYLFIAFIYMCIYIYIYLIHLLQYGSKVRLDI